MDQKSLTEEQIEKMKACASREELSALAKEEGIDLNDEQLEEISGGGWSAEDLKVYDLECGVCHKKAEVSGSAIKQWHEQNGANYGYTFVCPSCGETTTFLNM